MVCAELLFFWESGILVSARQRVPAYTTVPSKHQKTMSPNERPSEINTSRCCCLVTVSDSLQPHGLYLARLLCLWDVPGKNTGVGCRFLLQGNSLTQGSNPSLLHCRWILYQWSHQGSPYYIIVCFSVICCSFPCTQSPV